MRIPVILGFAALLAAPAAAAAQSTDETRALPVSGNVPGTCVVGGPTAAAGRMINFRGLNGNALQVDQLVDPITLSTNAASVELQFEAICTLPHRLKIETQNNGLWQTAERGPAAAEGFADAVPYRATVRWGPENLLLNADARVRRIAENSTAIETSAIGSILLRLEIDSGATNRQSGAPLLAGTYGDTLRITLEPQQ